MNVVDEDLFAATVIMRVLAELEGESTYSCTGPKYPI